MEILKRGYTTRIITCLNIKDIIMLRTAKTPIYFLIAAFALFIVYASCTVPGSGTQENYSNRYLARYDDVGTQEFWYYNSEQQLEYYGVSEYDGLQRLITSMFFSREVDTTMDLTYLIEMHTYEYNDPNYSNGPSRAVISDELGAPQECYMLTYNPQGKFLTIHYYIDGDDMSGTLEQRKEATYDGSGLNYLTEYTYDGSDVTLDALDSTYNSIDLGDGYLQYVFESHYTFDDSELTDDTPDTTDYRFHWDGSNNMYLQEKFDESDDILLEMIMYNFNDYGKESRHYYIEWNKQTETKYYYEYPSDPEILTKTELYNTVLGDQLQYKFVYDYYVLNDQYYYEEREYSYDISALSSGSRSLTGKSLGRDLMISNRHGEE
jgi:hypothetical protein